MKSSYLSLGFIGFGLFALSPVALLAQDAPLPTPDIPAVPEKPTKKALEGQAKTAANAAKIDKQAQKKRELVKKRIAEIHAKQADFLKRASEGKVQTFPNIRSKMALSRA